MNPVKYSSLEAQIAQTVAQKQAELLGGQELAVSRNSALGEEINGFIMDLVKDFPVSPMSGSRFINSSFEVCPKLVLRMSQLKPLLQRGSQDSLFSNEVGKCFEVVPLYSRRFGSFTTQATQLELTKIHFPNNGQVSANEWTVQKVIQESDLLAINRPSTIGEVDLDPHLKTYELRADVKFGDFTATNQQIIGETRDDKTLDLIVSLTHLSLHGKIKYDGSVTLENNESFSVEELIGQDPVTWVNMSHSFNQEFDLIDP